jgi:hypothetical protein
MLRLVLMHRHGCHLCDRMLARLRELGQARQFTLQVEDIDADADLQRRYNTAVPVLLADDEEISRYVLDEARLQEYLNTS